MEAIIMLSTLNLIKYRTKLLVSFCADWCHAILTTMKYNNINVLRLVSQNADWCHAKLEANKISNIKYCSLGLSIIVFRTNETYSS